MEENELQEAITQYKQQLNQIEALLQTDSNDELIQLKADLVELIKTTEESLLCLKKAKLLELLNGIDDDDGDTEAQCESFDKEEDNPDQPGSSSSGVSEIEKSISGTRCKAPYSFDWGVTGYYNAMVLSVEETDDSGTDASKVRVLFTNPTHRSMVPCPYFLDEKCRFDDDECRFSHGHVVNMAELKAYVEPDFSSLKVDEKCLAKYEDGIWYKATVLSLTAENVEVHYDTYNMDKTIKLEDVLPLEDQEDVSDHDSDLSSEDEENGTGEEKVIAEFCQVSDIGSGGALGDWERHTKGIASKLMAKMGYVFGKGLGKNEDGRVEPVEIILLPTGKSLDACAELREKNKLKQPFKRKKTKGNQNSKVEQVPVQDVFDFINNTLGGRKGNIEDLKHSPQSTTLDRRKSGKNRSHKSYNIELFKLEQEKLKIQKMLSKQQDSVSRNYGKDQNVMAQAKQRMTAMQGRIQDIERQEKLLKQKIHQCNEEKKLTVF